MGILQRVIDCLINVCLDSGAYLSELGLWDIFYVLRPIKVVHSCPGQPRATGTDSGNRLRLENDNPDLGVWMRPAISDTDHPEHGPPRKKAITLEHNRIIVYFPRAFAFEALHHNDEIQIMAFGLAFNKVDQFL
jgi:hypothetical protein